MRSYRITNRTSGAEMGTYEGETEQEALLAMVRDGGAERVEDPSDWILEEVDQVACECGDLTGEQCAWTGPRSEMVRIRYVVEHNRGSVTAAVQGAGGTTMDHAHERALCERSCAEYLVREDPEWVEIVEA